VYITSTYTATYKACVLGLERMRLHMRPCITNPSCPNAVGLDDNALSQHAQGTAALLS